MSSESCHLSAEFVLVVPAGPSAFGPRSSAPFLSWSRLDYGTQQQVTDRASRPGTRLQDTQTVRARPCQPSAGNTHGSIPYHQASAVHSQCACSVAHKQPQLTSAHPRTRRIQQGCHTCLATCLQDRGLPFASVTSQPRGARVPQLARALCRAHTAPPATLVSKHAR